MPFNSQLFLDDYPGATLGGTISATDAAIASLSAGSIMAALRQAGSRRSQAQQAIYLQNTGSRVIPNPMPLAAGAATVAPSSGAGSRDLSFNFGNLTYANGATNSIHRFDMTTKQMGAIGAQLVSTQATATGAVSSPGNVFIFNPQTMDRFTIATLSCSQVSSGLSTYGNLQAQPVAIGGTDVFAVLNIATALSVYTFATGVNTTTGTNLAANNIFYSSAVQSATNGYSFGGWISATAIQRVVLSTRVITTLGAVLPATAACAAGIGNSTVGFSVGGFTGVSNASTSALVQKLTYGGETTATVSATLSTALAFRHGSGSATSGILAGGSPNTSGTSGVTVTDEFTYTGETMARLSATLTGGVGMISSSSTYSPGFP